MSTLFSIGVVTDEVSRVLPEALGVATAWGISRVELREGERHRFPDLTAGEIASVESWMQDGGEVTAVSPGIFKAPAADEARLTRDLEEVLPRTIELAVRLNCPTVIAFGFDGAAGASSGDRGRVVAAFAAAAEQAAAAGLRVAVENEPGFWVDGPEASVALLHEVDHPALGLNWDPANLHWGGRLPTAADVETVEPFLLNVHVKDYGMGRPEAPWWPVGEGQTPWAELLPALADTDLAAVTLETHVVPLLEASRTSLAELRRLVADLEPTHSPRP